MHHSRIRVLRGAFIAVAAAGLLLLSSPDAQARRLPEDVFKGRVLTSNKRFATRAKSVSAYIKKLRKNTRSKLWEKGKDKKYEDRYWKVYFAAFFRRPLNDLEVTIKLYDITSSRAGRLVVAFEQFLDRRGQRTVISSFKLQRHKFGVNRKIRLEVRTHRGKLLAKGYFRLLGEREKFTGKVDFTKDD